MSDNEMQGVAGTSGTDELYDLCPYLFSVKQLNLKHFQLYICVGNLILLNTEY